MTVCYQTYDITRTDHGYRCDELGADAPTLASIKAAIDAKVATLPVWDVASKKITDYGR